MKNLGKITHSKDIVTKQYLDSLVTESIQNTTVVQADGESVITIPESMSSYMNLHVFHNGMLLVKDVHYTMGEGSITLKDHTTYSGDTFTFLYTGTILSPLSHDHHNKNILDSITQESIDKWNSARGTIEVFKVNGVAALIENGTVDITVPMNPSDIGAAPEEHEHEGYVKSETIFNENGLILPSLLPTSLEDIIEVNTYSELPEVGIRETLYITLDDNKTYRWGDTTYVPVGSSLSLGITEDTAFRGDYGHVAYEHSQETHAPINAQENIIEVFKVAGTALPVIGKTVDLPIATLDSLGLVRSSTEPNKVTVNEDGTMSVGQVSIDTLVPGDEELILSGGDAFSSNK